MRTCSSLAPTLHPTDNRLSLSGRVATRYFRFLTWSGTRGLSVQIDSGALLHAQAPFSDRGRKSSEQWALCAQVIIRPTAIQPILHGTLYCRAGSCLMFCRSPGVDVVNRLISPEPKLRRLLRAWGQRHVGRCASGRSPGSTGGLMAPGSPTDRPHVMETWRQPSTGEVGLDWALVT